MIPSFTAPSWPRPSSHSDTRAVLADELFNLEPRTRGSGDLVTATPQLGHHYGRLQQFPDLRVIQLQLISH
jgi:hypothetical protein